MQADSRSKLLGGVPILFLLASTCGCASSPTQLTMQPGASLSEYRIFEVDPASNDTGQTFSFDVSEFFTGELQDDLRNKGYVVASQSDAPGNILIVKCSIVSYSAGTVGKKAAAEVLGLVPGGFLMMPKDSTTVKTKLVDQKTGKVMADLVSNEAETESGIMPPTSFGNGHGISMISSQKLVLREAAWAVASKIDEQMKQ
jgi:hypothetical protein